MKRILPFLMIFLAAVPTAIACSFAVQDISFCQFANWNPEYTIARGKIVKRIDHGLRLELYEVYRGSETRSEVILWDREDVDCNGIIISYSTDHVGEVGQTILLVMEQIVTPEISWETSGDYRNSYSRFQGFDPFARPMVQSGDKLKGLFSDGINSVDLDDLADKLNNCTEDILSPPRIVGGSTELVIYPNPAYDFLFVQNEISPESEINIFDMSGRLVLRQMEYLMERGIRVNLLPEGIYILSIKSEGLIVRKKIRIIR
ncbi:MAG: T9SS type A sorting domain-containing protein [Bacteroidia bacterium]